MHLPTEVRRLKAVNASLQVSHPLWLSGYSDASWKESTKEGGWGLWVRDHETRILRAGPTPEWVTNITYAEFHGVEQALMTALNHLCNRWANIVVIKTDNQSVASWFGWQNGNGVPKLHEAQERMKVVYETAALWNIRIIVKWVKGHQRNDSTACYLNNRVDSMAGKARKDRETFWWTCPISNPPRFRAFS